jgi:hypothetical protein
MIHQLHHDLDMCSKTFVILVLEALFWEIHYQYDMLPAVFSLIFPMKLQDNVRSYGILCCSKHTYYTIHMALMDKFSLLIESDMTYDLEPVPSVLHHLLRTSFTKVAYDKHNLGTS